MKARWKRRRLKVKVLEEPTLHGIAVGMLRPRSCMPLPYTRLLVPHRHESNNDALPSVRIFRPGILDPISVQVHLPILGLMATCMATLEKLLGAHDDD
jgi:hypothetical protein